MQFSLIAMALLLKPPPPKKKLNVLQTVLIFITCYLMPNNITRSKDQNKMKGITLLKNNSPLNIAKYTHDYLFYNGILQFTNHSCSSDKSDKS